MRALILTQHFAPEVTAARFRLEAFATALAARGHRVDVVCAVPNHPRGVIEPEFRGRALVRRRAGDLSVDYVWVATTPTKTLATRLANYGSFAAMATTVAAFKRRPDVILASSPPLPVGAVGALAAARHRAPWVFDVRDLWPDVAVLVGEVTDPRVIGFAERLERSLYAGATSIVTVTEAFAQHIRDRTADPGKVEVIPNGTTRRWLEIGEADVERASLDLPEDRFVWTYAGNLGLSFGLDSVLEAAALLAGEGFRLLVIGEGPLKAELEAQAAALPAGEVEFRGLMSPGDAGRHLRASDALLVPHRAQLTKVVTSKLFDFCAVGRPVVLAADGEMARLAEEADAALAVPAESPQALAEALRRLRAEPALGERLAANGRRFAAAHLRELESERLAALLESVAAARPL